MNQKRTILGAIDFTLETMRNLKKELTDVGSKQSDTAWAIGGVIASLTSFLLQCSQEVIHESLHSQECNATDDLLEIQKRFNNFIDTMIGNHE